MRQHFKKSFHVPIEKNMQQEEKNGVKIAIFSRPLDLHHQVDLMVDLHGDEGLK